MVQFRAGEYCNDTRDTAIVCCLNAAADQPHCILESVVWGTLGSCSADSAAIQAVSTPGRGTAERWTEQSDCQHVNVTACDPMPNDPTLCAEWDFVSSGKVTTFLVPMNSSVRHDEWQIFETGEL